MTVQDDAGIPVAGRFQRIENALGRIEEKLDLKANVTEVSRIEARVMALENGTSPYNERLFQGFFQAQVDIGDLKLENSKNLPVLAMVPEMETRISSLESRTQTSEAVKTALETSQNNARQLRFAIIGIIFTAITTLGGTVIAIIQVIKGG